MSADPRADERLAAHEIQYEPEMTRDPARPYGCSHDCDWRGSEQEAAQHAHENGLCRECHGTGEGPGRMYGGDDSGIGPCQACGGGGTAEAEDVQQKAAEELDALMTRAEQEGGMQTG